MLMRVYSTKKKTLMAIEAQYYPTNSDSLSGGPKGISPMLKERSQGQVARAVKKMTE
jgi:hypothetical protein